MNATSPASPYRLAALVLLLAGTAGLAGAANQATPRPTPSPTATRPPRTLAEFARSMRLKHRPAGGGAITITNENIGRLAEQGGITTVTGVPSDAAAGAGSLMAPPSGAQSAEDAKRQMWRQRYTDARSKIQELEERERELEKEIPGLWNDFYKWDDPAYRDGVIKPKLDAAMAELEQVKKDLASQQDRPGEILDQARKDGAQPGWFRDLEQGPPPTPAP